MAQRQIEITVLEEQIKLLHDKVEEILFIVRDKSMGEKSIGDWIPEEQAIELSGLKKSSLFALRKTGRLSASTIGGKGVWYKKSDLVEILNENEKL